MSALADKIRKSRESVVSAGEFEFTIRRPTDMDMMQLSKSREPADMLRFVVGWNKVKELDLFPGGDGHPAPFDSEACIEWVSDRSDLLVTLVNAITDAYQAHSKAIEEAQKN
jgi:hypothetical protein